MPQYRGPGFDDPSWTIQAVCSTYDPKNGMPEEGCGAPVAVKRDELEIGFKSYVSSFGEGGTVEVFFTCLCGQKVWVGPPEKFNFKRKPFENPLLDRMNDLPR